MPVFTSRVQPRCGHRVEELGAEQHVGRDERLDLLGGVRGEEQRREVEDGVGPHLGDDGGQPRGGAVVLVDDERGRHGQPVDPHDAVHLPAVGREPRDKGGADEAGRAGDERAARHRAASKTNGDAKSASAGRSPSRSERIGSAMPQSTPAESHAIPASHSGANTVVVP